ncbi:MAG: urease accessory protein UreD [Verrucomicrobia bacterium]|nr:urease accessory protein UreD [Verrucomicrobiota bacterium]
MTAPGLGPWKARLTLGLERRGDRTVLVERQHDGPLCVQKALYPEGPEVCHVIVVHPPGGLAEGDQLQVEARIGRNAHAVISTPAATKWYKAASAPALQTVWMRLQDGARLEWLPQESLFFRRARAVNRLTVELPETATVLGWDLAMLGRIASGETWDEGHLRFETTLTRPGGRLLWTERAVLTGDNPQLRSRQGLAGRRVLGTLWASGPACGPRCAEMLAPQLPFTGTLRAGVTHFPGNFLLIRALADSMEILRTAMIDWWTRLRPLVHNLPAKPLRLWAT